MAKKMNSNEENSTVATPDVSQFLTNRHHISDITDLWVGIAPGQIQEGLTSKMLGQVEVADIIDTEVTVLGYQERRGKIKGKDTEWLICIFVPEGETVPSTFAMGGSVVVRKLRQAGEGNNFPVCGRIVSRTGASKADYYDFVS